MKLGPIQITRNQKPKPSSPTDTPSLWFQAMRETDGVAERLNENFTKWPQIHSLTEHISGLVYWAAQRLIDRKSLTKETRAQDEAIVLSCPRIFSDCLAGYQLVRRGMLLQAVVLLRSAFETTTQTILFVESKEHAESWLNGKQIPPREVRAVTDMPQRDRDLYRKLSNLAHPNYEAVSQYSVPVPMTYGVGIASPYGGWYAPKETLQLAIQFIWAQLIFLERFYAVYEADLASHGLLWRTDQPEGTSWNKVLGDLRQALSELSAKHDEETPSDFLGLATALTDYSEDEKAKFPSVVAELDRKRKAEADLTEGGP